MHEKLYSLADVPYIAIAEHSHQTVVDGNLVELCTFLVPEESVRDPDQLLRIDT